MDRIGKFDTQDISKGGEVNLPLPVTSHSTPTPPPNTHTVLTLPLCAFKTPKYLD